MRFDLFETLEKEGYVMTEHPCGWLNYVKDLGNIRVVVETNRSHEYAHACFYENGNCFKLKTYKAPNKRAYNGINEALEWRGVKND